MPEVAQLVNPPLEDIVERLKGEVLTARDGLEKVYEHILVGAMTPEMASRYFSNMVNKVVITGGDGTDLILAALDTPTIALILTGGIYPDSRVVKRAEELGAPLILVNYDTHTATALIHQITGED